MKIVEVNGSTTGKLQKLKARKIKFFQKTLAFSKYM